MQNSFHYIDGLAQDCSRPTALAMELPQSYTKPLWFIYHVYNTSLFGENALGLYLILVLNNWQ